MYEIEKKCFWTNIEIGLMLLLLMNINTKGNKILRSCVLCDDDIQIYRYIYIYIGLRM
jgi:hypothetical protein